MSGCLGANRLSTPVDFGHYLCEYSSGDLGDTAIINHCLSLCPSVNLPAVTVAQFVFPSEKPSSKRRNRASTVFGTGTMQMTLARQY
jgi:hypothetical protein